MNWSPFSRRYPAKDRLHFDGGKNNKYDKTLILDNESPDCLNVIFDDGAVETRPGTAKFNTTTVGSFACDGLYTRHNNTGSETMVAWYGGSMYELIGTSTFAAVASSVSIFTSGQRVYADEYENYIFFGNGAATPYKYNGHFTRHGIPAPASGATAATAGTGTALTGQYYYAVTYVNSALVEGDISPLTTTITVAGQNIALTSIPTAPVSFGVNARYIYRTANGGSTLKRLATLSNNTATTYDDAIADASLGATAPTDQGEPPTYSSVLYHQGRLFVIDPVENDVKYSEIGNPYVFKANSFEIIGDNTVDIPVGLAVYDNSIIVFCKRNPWIIYMPSTDPDEWTVLRVRANFGSASPFSYFKYDNKVMFAAVQNDKFVGFAAVEGQTVSPSASLLTSSALGSELQSNAIEPDMFLVQETYMRNITSMVYQNKAYVALTYGDGNTTNNRIYVYDFTLNRVSKQQKAVWVPWTGLNAAQFTVYGSSLYYATSTATGFVYKMNQTTYGDDGSAINSYIWTKEFSGLPGDENVHKDFRYAQVFYEKSGDYFMGFTAKVDSDAGSGNTTQIDLNPGGSLWGSMVWGRDLWGGGSTEGEYRHFLAPLRGKRIQFKFSNQNTVNQKFKVVGLNFVYNKKGLR
jgi:hypothetical protein